MMNTLLTAASIAFTDPKSTPKRSARRCLFGKRDETDDDFVRQLIDEMQEEYKNKWEFDFVSDSPLPTSSNSRFFYTQVDPASVPGFYRLSRYASSTGASQEFDSENKDPEDLQNVSMHTEDSFLLPTTDESAMSDFFNESDKDVLKSAKSLAATPKKRQSRLNEFLPTRKHLQRSAKKSDLLSSPSPVRHTPSRLRKCSAISQ
uniref:Cyclin-dependent kinase inhibitor domain-containing protein n=1 Tax=Acrobeloides nanus TaxID=290746 RepID=A0A914DM59_9BILA